MSQSNFIAGTWATGSGERFSSFNPANGDVIWSANASGRDNVRDAFAAARSAFADWALAGFDARKTIIERYEALVRSRAEDIAALIALETGKPLWESKTEAGAMAAKAGVSIKAAQDRAGRTRAETDFGEQVLDHKPLGVMLVLGPYNFPGHLPNGHIIPALLAGNTLVFKPSELTPAVGELMVKLWSEAGLPAGVLNLIHGARDTGAAALNDPDLDGVLFTGSWNTGAMIHKMFAGRTGVQLALEMGGNNPLVVWDTEDAKASAHIAVLSSYITAGQRCSCARRLILPEGAFGDAVIESIASIIPRLSIGPANQSPEPFMGPLISERAADHVIAQQDKLLTMGAEAIVRAEKHEAGPAFVTPGLLSVDGVDCVDEEIFGPMIQVRRVSSFEQALAEANNTAYGLSAGLVSDNDELWKTFWAGSRAGIVNRNRPTTGAASTMPFGGPGQSGNLRPSAYYAADYCAYPVATQASPKAELMAIKGLD